MKAYQVFNCGQDKHDREYQELVATYLDKDKAFKHAEKIANETKLYGGTLQFDGFYSDGKCASWSEVGWEHVTIAKWEEIEITE
jgi:hypothetical protein